METHWDIKTEDGHVIYGLLNKPENKKNKKAILLIHGLTGHPHEYHHTSAAFAFPALGYDVIRPYLYCSEDNARKLVDCTIAIHSMDINTMAQFFSTQYDELYAVGHSFGGPSVIGANTQAFKAISLWDPSIEPKETLIGTAYVKPYHDLYLLSWEPDILIGKAMYEEAKDFDVNKAKLLAQACTSPVQVILAGDGKYAKKGFSYNDFVSTPTDLKIIPGSDHCFNEEGTTEPLLLYTREWFDKF
ncbi:MAG: hypothetical protein JWM96_191 [Alphaproteobacteria bacterium]|nr:hypothetical protein [Alphaproteobacteria bacterium]